MADLALSVSARLGNDSTALDEDLLGWARAGAVFSKIGSDSIAATPPLWVWAKAIQARAKLGEDKFVIQESWMRALSAFSKASTDSVNLTPVFSRALAALGVVGEDTVSIESLLADIISPPSADIFLVKDGREQVLDNNKITRHDSCALNFYVTGERVASEINGSMNVTFTAKINPYIADENATIKRTLKNGGVRYLGTKEVTTYQGKENRAYYQIRLLPNDTKSLEKDTWLHYDVQLDDGLINGERHTVASGKFLVVFDLYRGMGGNRR